MASAFFYIRRERASVWEPPPPPVRRLTPRSPSPAGRLLCASVFAYLSAMIIAFLSVLLNFTVRLPEAKPPRWGGGPRSEPANGRWWGFPFHRSFTKTDRRCHVFEKPPRKNVVAKIISPLISLPDQASFLYLQQMLVKLLRAVSEFHSKPSKYPGVTCNILQSAAIS